MSERSFVPTASPIFRPGSIQPHYRLKLVHLTPPVIVNLREDRNPGEDKNARDLLRPEELQYFRKSGNNAVIFIHGFNVEYGRYSPHVELADWHYDILRGKRMSPRLVYSQGLATTYRDRETLKKQYLKWQEKGSDIFHGIDLENLNGAGAHAWFLHVEDNLNRATGQFDRTDYSKYARLIHVAWSGDVFQANYMAAETNANKAGFGLARLIDQLAGEKIKVNVIAHSLGNRVLLVAMNLLGQMPNRKECIDHVFMWQPAVPDTALSNDRSRDTSVLRNWNFIFAHLAAKKIVVLYSNRDNVLGKHVDGHSVEQDRAAGERSEAFSGKAGGVYRIASVAGIPGTQLVFAPWAVPALYARNFVADNLPKVEKALQQEIAKDGNGLFTDHLAPTWPEILTPLIGPLIYARRLGREAAEDAMKTVRALTRTDYAVNLPRPAMGYGGPELDSDPLVRRMYRDGKLEPINQTPWLSSHSGMKIPDDVLYEEVYVKAIMRRIMRDSAFGVY